MPQHTKPDPIKWCFFCGALLARKRYNGILESNLAFLRRKFCDLSCAKSKHNPGRQEYTRGVRRYRQAYCERCGTSRNLAIHHKDRNWKNNNPSNLQTLCSVCHTRLHWKEDPSFGAPRKKYCSICAATH